MFEIRMRRECRMTLPSVKACCSSATTASRNYGLYLLLLHLYVCLFSHEDAICSNQPVRSFEIAPLVRLLRGVAHAFHEKVRVISLTIPPLVQMQN